MRAITYAITDRASFEAVVRVLKAKHPTLHQLKIPANVWRKIYRAQAKQDTLQVDGVHIYCSGDGGKDYR